MRFFKLLANAWILSQVPQNGTLWNSTDDESPFVYYSTSNPYVLYD